MMECTSEHILRYVRIHNSVILLAYFFGVTGPLFSNVSLALCRYHISFPSPRHQHVSFPRANKDIPNRNYSENFISPEWPLSSAFEASIDSSLLPKYRPSSTASFSRTHPYFLRNAD